MRTKVDRVINITETVQTEVDFPRYTRDLFFYYKHYSFNHCVVISIVNSFASVSVTHNNNGKNLFDEEITEDVFYHAMERVSAMLMPELQPTQKATDWTPAPEYQVNEWGETIWQRNERQQKQEEKI